MGTSSLSEVTLNWSFDGVLQPPVTVSWQNPLLSKELDTITLGTLSYTAEADYEIKIWISEFGLLSNDFPEDDTVSIPGYICPSKYGGSYTVGATGYFTSIADALAKIKRCSLNGDITLKLLPGIHQEDIDLKEISFYTGNYTFTLTSSTGNSSSVILETQSTGIQLSNSNNIVISDITINTRTNNTNGIKFVGSCNNVVITRCVFLADTIGITAATSAQPILKSISVGAGNPVTGIANNISITHNIVEGGWNGIYFASGTGSTVLGTNLIIDSNIIRKQISDAIYCVNTDKVNISGNIILSRTSNTLISWTGLSVNYSNGNITNNRILQQSNAITQPRGMYFNSLNRNLTTDTALVANNEIILYMASSYNGIYLSYSKVRIINNSIYIKGAGIARGIEIVDHNTLNYMIIKNNNIVMESLDAYPIYLPSIVNVRLYDMDYNNIYAPVYVGYAGVAKTNMFDWRQAITSDKHSIIIYPHFIDNSFNLELSDYSGLTCFQQQGVTKDINGNTRGFATAMGAYHHSFPFDLEMQTVICNDTTVVYPQSVPVKIEILNKGSNDPVDSATFGWSVNGVRQPSTTWIANNPLGIGESINVPVGSFVGGRYNDFNIVVWIESVNGCKDSVVWNDTAKTSVKVLSTGSNLSIQII
jgi:hypothetical protein